MAWLRTGGTALLCFLLLVGGMAGGGVAFSEDQGTDTGPSPSAGQHGLAAVSGELDGAAGFTPVVVQSNTTATLRLDGALDRTASRTTGLDVAGAMAVDAAELHGEYTRRQITHRYANAETDAQRRATVRWGATLLERRIDTLHQREVAARGSFGDGSLSTEAVLRRLAIVGTSARTLERATTALAMRATAVGEPTVSTARVADLRADLIGLQGPVRDQIARAEAGTAERTRVYIETDGQGVTLATVVTDDSERQFLRSAHVPGARNATLADQFANGSESRLDAAESRARELYPWAFQNRIGSSVGLLAGGPPLTFAGVYPVTVNHPQGTVRQDDLIVYLDGGTTDAFREIQYLSVPAMPTTTMGRASAGDLNLTVNETYRGGPMTVRVTNATGAPVEATILLNGDRIGSTGFDGRRTVIAPGGQVNVTAVRGDDHVTVTGTV